MKFILKIFTLIIVFIICLLAFLPKEQFYFKAEEQLVKKNIILSSETIKEELFVLKINDAELYYDGIFTAYLSKSQIKTYLFYSNIELENIRLSKSFENFVPSKIDRLNLQHSVLEFDKIKIKGTGDFGVFEGDILLLEKKLVGELKPSKIMKSKYKKLLKEFKIVEFII